MDLAPNGGALCLRAGELKKAHERLSDGRLTLGARVDVGLIWPIVRHGASP